MSTQLLIGHFLLLSSLLASGSDDQHAIVWDPFRHKKLTTMHTGHAANIFSVKVSRTLYDISAVLVFYESCSLVLFQPPLPSDVAFLGLPSSFLTPGTGS